MIIQTLFIQLCNSAVIQFPKDVSRFVRKQDTVPFRSRAYRSSAVSTACIHDFWFPGERKNQLSPVHISRGSRELIPFNNQ